MLSFSFIRAKKLRRGLSPSNHGPALGTIGGGNHFVELQRVEKIHSKHSFAVAGLKNDRLFLSVHSGSRGIGECLLRRHTEKYGAKGLGSHRN